MVVIEKHGGARHRLYDELGVQTAELKVNPIDIVYGSENINNAPGRNRTKSHHGIRKLQLKLTLRARNSMQTDAITSVLARIFDLEEDFYIYQSIITGQYGFELPGQSAFTSAAKNLEYTDLMYKRWLVERVNNDGIEWKALNGKRVIELETSQLPYAESPYTTQELRDKTWSANQWAWNMGIKWSDAPPQYTFNTNNFMVQNYGDIVIDPNRRIPLRIELHGTFSSDVTITNTTTGDTFVYDGGLASGDVLVLDNIQMLKNGISIVGSSNKKTIKLAQGENHFVISGGTVTSCKFDFRFYYV